LERRSGAAGDLGIAIQSLSPEIASATGGATGVVIAAVDPAGAAAGRLLATEVIEAVDGQEVHTPDHWRARAARVNAGDTLTLRVRGREGVREVQLTAGALAASAEPTGDASLGLRLRAIPKVGAEVLSVEPRSNAERATIREGDIITVAGGRPSPMPAEVMRAFAALPDRGSLVVAIARGTEHRVIVIEK
jgi:S1-C subfamily serine protease